MKILSKSISLIILLIVIATTFVTPKPVYALTSTLTVQGEGVNTSGTYPAGVGDWHDVTNDDGDTSYLRYGIFGVPWYQQHDYDFTSFAASYSQINSVTLYWKAKVEGVTGNTTFTPYVIVNGVQFIDAADASAVNCCGYVTKSKTWTTDPSTGAKWQAVNLNLANTYFGARGGSGVSADFTWVTYTYVVVDYDPVVAPSVITSAATGVGATSATLNGNITSNGGSAITDYGFIWDTASHGNPGNVAHDGATGYANNWGGGAGAVGAITYAGAVLVHGTTYYFRAGAGNAIGWTWGDELSFSTFDHSTVTIVAASNVASTTATLNATMTTGGDPSTTVEFVYASGNHANYAAIAAAGGHVHVAGSAGANPFANAAGLTTSTLYSFGASSKNTVDAAYGTIVSAVSQFTTESGVFTPTNFVAIPTSTTISLMWTKGIGASHTWIRYSTSTYPAATGAGVATYSGTGASYLLTGLTPGTNYYFSVWGLTGGVYSASYATVIATCLSPGTTATPVLPPPATPSQWKMTTPTTTAVSNLPFNEFVEYFANSYSIPSTTMWYGLIIMFSVGAGLFAYWRGNNNLPAGMLLCAVGLAIGSIVWNLVYLWILVFFLLTGIAIVFFAGRYP